MLDLGFMPFFFTRFLIGICHSSILACSYTLFASWLQKEKKANAVIWVNIGFELGGFISFFLTGYISSLSPFGWRYSFYLFSIISFVWFLPFYYLVYSKPEDDPNLSDYERQLMQREQIEKKRNNDDDFNDDDNQTKKLIKVAAKFNFKTVLTSKVVWADLITKSTSGLGYFIIATKVPDYLSKVFNVPIRDNGFYSALPFLAILIAKLMCLKLSDFLINLNVMSLTSVRKVFQSACSFIPAICLFLLTIKNDNKDVDIFLLFLGMLGQGMGCAGDAAMTAEVNQTRSYLIIKN